MVYNYDARLYRPASTPWTTQGIRPDNPSAEQTTTAPPDQGQTLEEVEIRTNTYLHFFSPSAIRMWN